MKSFALLIFGVLFSLIFYLENTNHILIWIRLIQTAPSFPLTPLQISRMGCFPRQRPPLHPSRATQASHVHCLCPISWTVFCRKLLMDLSGLPGPFPGLLPGLSWSSSHPHGSIFFLFIFFFFTTGFLYFYFTKQISPAQMTTLKLSPHFFGAYNELLLCFSPTLCLESHSSGAEPRVPCRHTVMALARSFLRRQQEPQPLPASAVSQAGSGDPPQHSPRGPGCAAPPGLSVGWQQPQLSTPVETNPVPVRPWDVPQGDRAGQSN